MVATKKFEASQFTATQYDTAADKAKFANDFVRLVRGDFKPTLFSKKFYTRLSMTFGHIAHFDHGGFYHVQLSDDARRLNFLRQTLEWPAFGDPTYTFSDVEKALATWVKDNGLIDVYAKRVADATETAERVELARLIKKYAKETDNTALMEALRDCAEGLMQEVLASGGDDHPVIKDHEERADRAFALHSTASNAKRRQHERISL